MESLSCDAVTMAKPIVTWHSWKMGDQSEREKDLALIDSAASGMAELANMELNAETVVAEDFRAYCRVKIEAAKALVPLLERRAALLGLDAPKQESKSANQSGSLAELEQKLALSDRLGKGGAS